jgi:hypothetical protein
LQIIFSYFCVFGNPADQRGLDLVS